MPTLSTTDLDQQPARLYFLDWLRVIAVLGVFLFHAVHPFDLTPWHIKNAEQSAVVTFFIAFMFPWGMPFFFLLAGAGSSFALRRRTAGQFARERFHRLLLPFIGGSVLLMPVMLYFEWRHKVQTGVLTSPFVAFVLDRNEGFTPIWFGALGYHLWFLGFLFSFSLLCLPIFLWLKGDARWRLLSRLATMCERRGALLLFIIPLAIVRLALHPFFPQEHNWADFFVQMSFFLLGYMLFSQQGFLHAIRRDWRINVGVGIGAAASALAIAASTGTLDLQAPPRTLLDVLFWILISIDSWCWTLFFLFIGMRYLDYTDYRKNGTPVVATVWFAQANDTVYLWTAKTSGKMKRIRNNSTEIPCIRAPARPGERSDVDTEQSRRDPGCMDAGGYRDPRYPDSPARRGPLPSGCVCCRQWAD